MHRSLLVLLLALVLGPAGVLADEKPAKPLTTEQAADAVLTAVQAQDQAALEALAEKDAPDPWLVAELLCFRGEHDAAEAFAKVAPRKAVEKLPTYVASRRGKEPDDDEWNALRTMSAALPAQEWKAVLDAAAGLDGPLDSIVRIRLARYRGRALRGMRQWRESSRVLVEAGGAARRLGWRWGAADAFSRGGVSASGELNWRGAASAWKSELQILRELNATARVRATLGNIASAQRALGNFKEAVEWRAKALQASRQEGHTGGIAAATRNLATAHKCLGNHAEALKYYYEALKTFRQLDMPGYVAAIFRQLSEVHDDLGNYAEALTMCDRALEAYRVLGNRVGVAWVLATIGTVQSKLGDHRAALEYIGQALKVFEELGPKWKIGETLTNLGTVHLVSGNLTEALRFYKRSLPIYRAFGDTAGFAFASHKIGTVQARLGNDAEALKLCAASLELYRDLGNEGYIATALCDIGHVHFRLGNYPRATEAYEEARKLLEQSPRRTVQASVSWGMANLHLRQGRPGEAADCALKGLAYIAMVSDGLAEGEGVGARERFSGLFDVAYRASLEADDETRLGFAMEQGRAGSLRESLGSRSALEAAVIPLDLRTALTLARYAERKALDAYTKQRQIGDLTTTRTARSAWMEAQAGVSRVAKRIERDAKHAAAVTLSAPDNLATIQGYLDPTEALVYFALTSEEAIALIVRKDKTRIVALAASAEIEALVADLALDDLGEDSREGIARLRESLVDPLALPTEVRRVLVSPMSRLGYVPFALLFPKREVAYVPSGTTHGLLLEERNKHGKMILGLGDPDYQTKVDEVALKIRAGNVSKLARLPATKREVEAIADIRLLDKQATETGLRDAVEARSRWRAVHFACHGLVDPDRPMLSALALTADTENDGFLTALEIFRMKIPADLVVMSACETGKGKIYKTEGIVGLTRAFMFAGAPRVICSLWKVDDEATQALMIKFYELWNPEDGTKGLGAAAALKEAQAFIKGHDKWKHPYYWAAWVLWGLPD